MQQLLRPDQVVAAATQLTEARRSICLIEDLGDATPLNLPSANAIADAHAAQLGWDTVGWKVGCTSVEAMQILNSPEPFAGRVYDGCVHGSGIVHHDAMINPGVESEFAFMLGLDLPPIDGVYSVEDVRAATVAVAPALELVAPRFSDFTGIGYLSLIADSGANGGVVLGEPVATEDCPDLGDVVVELELDGVQIKTGHGSAILGDPWRALAWIANDLSVRQIGLLAGHFVMSGTCTGIDPLSPGSVATGRYSDLGSVEIKRTSELD
jgi:2-keto-4-pentenoate hydratase